MQLVFQFIRKLFSGIKVRAWCRNLFSPAIIELALCTVIGFLSSNEGEIVMLQHRKTSNTIVHF